MHAETLKMEKIGEKPNHVQYGQRDLDAKNPTDYRQGYESENVRRRRKGAEVPFSNVRVRSVCRWSLHRRSLSHEFIRINGLSQRCPIH